MQLLEREQALARLASAYAEAGGGHGRLVLVRGEPGIGKTTLVEHFVAGLPEGARVLLGTCDDLSIPRPLGPFRDMIGAASAQLERAFLADAPPHEIHRLLLEELTLPPRPTVVVIEDLHWADHATLDAVNVIARRLASLPALVVATVRPGEAPPALARVTAGDPAFIDLEPLSQTAVHALAGANADAVYEVTRGNPFFVSELVACGDEETVPASIANAVLGRVAQLDDHSRELVDLVAVVPGRVSTDVLDAAFPEWASAAEDPERRRLLAVRPKHVRFQHELARTAIETRLTSAARRKLHTRVLEALLATHGEPAEIVHHAEGAGAVGVVGEFALVAARRAAAVESHSEAYAHYRRARDFVELHSLDEQAALYEELTRAAYFVGRLDVALAAAEHGLDVHRDLDNQEGIGRSLRNLSRLRWFAGDGPAARAAADEALATLEPLGESWELARAHSGIGQLAMLASDYDRAIDESNRALEMAARLGAESTCVHARINIATARLLVDPDAGGDLLHAYEQAHRVGNAHEATRALGNLAYGLLLWARPAAALEHAKRAWAYAQDHELHGLATYNAGIVAWLLLRAGEWDEAESLAQRQLTGHSTTAEILALTVLTELAVRRGDDDADGRLAELTALMERTRETLRIIPALELTAERALTSGRSLPAERLAELLGGATGGEEMRLAAWAAVAGVDVENRDVASPAYAAMRRRDWRAAADAFGAIGWSYDRALSLSLLDDAESLGEAVSIARGLGAAPLASAAARRMRDLGLRIPRGPREATRTNPAHLTQRQLQVAALLRDGLTNAEIAEELVISLRTAEHHVAAVLTKLGASDRREAARRAAAFEPA